MIGVVVMKIVFLDSKSINPGDISWKGLQALGEFAFYDMTPAGQEAERIGDAEAVFVDSVEITESLMKKCPKLKFIGVGATGYNNIDIKAAERLGIAVANVPAYSTEAVAQHAFALLLSLVNRVREYGGGIAEGRWCVENEGEDFSFPLTLLHGKSIGIVGYGNIGKKVGEIAQAFGMTVNVYSRDREKAISSDVVSLHCPLTEETAEMVDGEFISKMKDGAVFINTARGGLVDEYALADALKSGKLAAAGLDVMKNEPPESSNPLIRLKNCLITPHIAFTPVETRRIVVETCEKNLRAFINGERLNRIV